MADDTDRTSSIYEEPCSADGMSPKADSTVMGGGIPDESPESQRVIQGDAALSPKTQS